MPVTSSEYVLPFEDLRLEDVQTVGGKNASLGEMTRVLSERGVRIPKGFAITAEVFRRHLRQGGLEEFVYPQLEKLDVSDTRALAAAGHLVRDRIRAVPLGDDVAAEIRQSYEALSAEYGEEESDVAVRSSATAEDSPSASFAGQQETFLNVRGWIDLEEKIRACMASLFTDRAIVYREQHGFDHRTVAISVGIQKMVRSDLASAGVIFTLDTESGFGDVILVTGVWGLGETIVQGRANPDEFRVHKPTLKRGYRSIVRRELGEKARKLVYLEGGTKAVQEVPVPLIYRQQYVLDDDEVLELSRWALAIEEYYSERYGRWTPMDIEWAKDGLSGELFVVQARPETVHSQAERPRVELFSLCEQGTVLVQGKSVGSKIASGRVRVITSVQDLRWFQEGEVLVAEMTDPDWEPVLRGAVAVVTDQGGRTCHAAIVSRELGIPCVVGTGLGTHVLDNERQVTVSCAEGEEGRVYDGILRYDCERIDPATLPRSKVPILLNVANPDNAFRLAQLPVDGVGLLGVELLIASRIGIHPMALLHSDRVSDVKVWTEIRKRTASHSSPSEFFVERLSTGLAQIAAAFYPRPVFVRFSDFRSDEYADLLGGSDFEVAEANPTIGLRGASRYLDDRYREAFALECQAIRRLQEENGLTNVNVMVPYCRTLEEARRLQEEMKQNGLVRGENGLEIWVECDVPNNILLAEEFGDLFDGFSIGSNDLAQLTLGVDRDSELLTHLFDERDPGVKRFVSQMIAAAHGQGKKVGICGQAPSDCPGFAEYLVSQGIDTISLDPDALATVSRRLASMGSAECM